MRSGVLARLAFAALLVATGCGATAGGTNPGGSTPTPTPNNGRSDLEKRLHMPPRRFHELSPAEIALVTQVLSN